MWWFGGKHTVPSGSMVNTIRQKEGELEGEGWENQLRLEANHRFETGAIHMVIDIILLSDSH